jgi:hypothetical protein
MVPVKRDEQTKSSCVEELAHSSARFSLEPAVTLHWQYGVGMLPEDQRPNHTDGGQSGLRI